MAKRTNHNAESGPTAKKWFDEYTDMFTFRVKPISETALERLAAELIVWAANDEKALKLSTFFKKKGISSTTIARWKERSETFKEAYQYALEIIGDRRETGGIERKYDAGMITSSMPHYDPDWKALAEWRFEKTKKQENSEVAKVQYVILPNITQLPSGNDEQ